MDPENAQSYRTKCAANFNKRNTPDGNLADDHPANRNKGSTIGGVWRHLFVHLNRPLNGQEHGQ